MHKIDIFGIDTELCERITKKLSDVLEQNGIKTFVYNRYDSMLAKALALVCSYVAIPISKTTEAILISAVDSQILDTFSKQLTDKNILNINSWSAISSIEIITLRQNVRTVLLRSLTKKIKIKPDLIVYLGIPFEDYAKKKKIFMKNRKKPNTDFRGILGKNYDILVAHALTNLNERFGIKSSIIDVVEKEDDAIVLEILELIHGQQKPPEES